MISCVSIPVLSNGRYPLSKKSQKGKAENKLFQFWFTFRKCFVFLSFVNFYDFKLVKNIKIEKKEH